MEQLATQSTLKTFEYQCFSSIFSSMDAIQAADLGDMVLQSKLRRSGHRFTCSNLRTTGRNYPNISSPVNRVDSAYWVGAKQTSHLPTMCLRVGKWLANVNKRRLFYFCFDFLSASKGSLLLTTVTAVMRGRNHMSWRLTAIEHCCTRNVGW